MAAPLTTFNTFSRDGVLMQTSAPISSQLYCEADEKPAKSS